MRISRNFLRTLVVVATVAATFVLPLEAQSPAAKATLLVLPVRLDLANASFILPGDSALAPQATAALRASLKREDVFVLADSAKLQQGIDSIAALSEPCNDDRCALAMAKLVGAAKVLTTKVTKFSSLLWFVDVRLLDVATGKPLRVEEFKLDGVADQIVPATMNSVGRRFSKPSAGVS